MNKDFDLSEKIDKDINLLEKNDDLIKAKYVKEFIRLIKEQVWDIQDREVIDKLAGGKLK